MTLALAYFTFHGVGAVPEHVGDDERRVWLSAGSFDEILDHLRGREGVKITFDDGNLSDLAVALPALLKRGMSATFFALAGRIGHRGYLDVKHLRELRDAGMTVGLHGMDHRPWGKLGIRELKAEIRDARSRLSDALQGPVNLAACPFGSYSRRCLAYLQAEHFEHVYTSDRGGALSDQWLQPRNTLVRSDSLREVDQILALSAQRDSLLKRAKLLIKRTW